MISCSKNQKKVYIKDLLSHKKYLFDSVYKIFEYLLENDEEELALNILRRSFSHDFSKLSEKEFNSFAAFKEYNANLKDATLSYSKEEEVFLKEHWKNNQHHPEYWDDVNDMKEIDIIEMVCDWHARSMEFNTDLREFVEARQNNRFHFNDTIYSKVTKYVEILLK